MMTGSLQRGLVAAIALMSLGACTAYQPATQFGPAPPYPILPVDEMMSCEAMTASFIYSARRAARLEYWLKVGPLPGYRTDTFGVDAQRELVAERRRLDALSDVQRMRGCPVMEPAPAVLYERQKLENAFQPSVRVRG